MRIVSQEEMKEIENQAKEEFGFDENLIVENVGISGAGIILKRFAEIDVERFVFLIGKGNNGSDGLSIARHLVCQGFPVSAFMLFEESEWSEELKKQYQLANSFGVRVSQLSSSDELSSYFAQLSDEFVCVDAIFGTGVRLPVSNLVSDIIKEVNNRCPYVIAVDIPTGVSGNEGQIQGQAIQANLTLSVGLPKLGQFISDGAKRVGEIEVLFAGLPLSLTDGGNKKVLNFDGLKEYAARRNRFADKKRFGHSLVLGGSHGLTGALVLASQASLKVGAGVVTAATWENQYQEFISRLIPEIMTGYLPMDTSLWGRLIDDLDKYNSVVIGPGLAKSTRARKLVLVILQNYKGPVVLDADAINVLNLDEDTEILKMRNAPTILTPHYGEFAKLTKTTYEEVKANPLGKLTELVDHINCAVLLKGPCTLLGFPNGDTYFNFFPNDGMATGGVGDVLAGILGGLLAQDSKLVEEDSLFERYEDFTQAIRLGVMIHTQSGQFAASELGVRAMTAMSIIDYFPSAFADMKETLKDYK